MFEKIKDNWDKIRDYLKNEYDLSDVSYKTWILPLVPVSLDEDTNTLYIVFSDEEKSLMIEYVIGKYKIKLEVSIEEITGMHVGVMIVSQAPQKEQPAQTAPSKQPYTLDSEYAKSANLNPRYTFDTFVVGPNNNLAHAASLAVAESPAEKYNPLFLYGGVGLGKTHLMHSIAHFVLNNDPTKKILYISSENFMNDMIESIRNKNPNAMSEFRSKYRTNDILLIDDIQFIADKEGTQEEFFHTFNALYEAKKQIVISSDKPPKALTTLEDRLRSRFEMGLTADISTPDYETRMAILRKKEESEGYNIDNEVLKYIAEHIKTNIRELEGALTKIIAFSKLNKAEINVATAEEALKDLISPEESRKVTSDYIIHMVADHFNLQDTDLKSTKKSNDVAFPRQIAMYLCKEMTDDTLSQIAEALCKKDHTTVLHGYKKIKNDLNTDSSLKSTVDILVKKINPS
jgi:chromosomal replication initiator protein